MSRKNIKLLAVDIKTPTVSGVLDALAELSVSDNDFNGNNGPEYLWSISKESNFNSNQEYVLDFVSKFSDLKQIIKTFMRLWLDGDDYYEGYKYKIICNSNNLPIAISLAYFN